MAEKEEHAAWFSNASSNSKDSLIPNLVLFNKFGSMGKEKGSRARRLLLKTKVFKPKNV